MTDTQSFIVGILYPGDRAARSSADPAAGGFSGLFTAMAAAGIRAEPAVYHDDFADEVAAQLCRVDAVLVWHNPIEDGRTRKVLDAMLRRVTDRGVFVSTHPDTILRMGTKDVLVDVRDPPFGTDSRRIASLRQLVAELPRRLEEGPRVLKQHRGHSGIGVWRIEQLAAGRFSVRHAQRGPDDPRFQRLRRLLEDEWVELLRERLGVAPERLPLLWDADFLLGGAPGATDDRYVLCEINVSSVSPYPESANAALVEAVRALSPKAH